MQSAEPLLRHRGLRGAVAVALVVTSTVVVALGWYFLIWLFSPPVFLAAFAILAASPLAVAAMLEGWAPRPRLRKAAVALTAVGLAGFAAAAAVPAVDLALARRPLGVPPGETAAWFGSFALCLLGLGLVLASVPLRPDRRVRVAVMAVIGVALLGGVAAVSLVAAGDRCGSFEFDAARWRAALAADDGGGPWETDAERMADAIAACGVLDDKTRTEVRELIGRPYGGRRVWRWSVGWVNDALGPGDGQELVVAFDRRGRVRTVRVSPP